MNTSHNLPSAESLAPAVDLLWCRRRLRVVRYVMLSGLLIFFCLSVLSQWTAIRICGDYTNFHAYSPILPLP